MSDTYHAADDVRTGVTFPEDVAAAFVKYAQDCIDRGGRFTVALSGGSTPRGLYEALAAAPFDAQVSWARTWIFQGDERCVPPDHPDSNWGLAKRTLLDHVSVDPAKLHRMEAEAADLDDAARRYESTLNNILGPDGGLDLVLLGMGDDGHTASLFPGTAALDETARLVVANEVPQLDTRRMTMTFPALQRARAVWFLVAGAGKAERVRQILVDGVGFPAARAHPARGAVTWFLDAAASAALDRAGV